MGVTHNGTIIATEHELAYGRKSLTYEWEGSDVADVDIDYLYRIGIKPETVIVGERLNIGPFPVRVVNTDGMLLWHGRVQVMRGNRVHTWIRATIHRNSRWLDRVYRRLIITGYVWGFATVHEAMIPTWRDVHILRRIAERLGK